MHCLMLFMTKPVYAFVVWRKQNQTQAFSSSKMIQNKTKYRAYIFQHKPLNIKHCVVTRFWPHLIQSHSLRHTE